ncbi:hypothetical protein EAY17_22990 [Escherichia coli]|nr:hypothetical protein [Escherichia coli]
MVTPAILQILPLYAKVRDLMAKRMPRRNGAGTTTPGLPAACPVPHSPCPAPAHHASRTPRSSRYPPASGNPASCQRRMKSDPLISPPTAQY